MVRVFIRLCGVNETKPPLESSTIDHGYSPPYWHAKAMQMRRRWPTHQVSSVALCSAFVTGSYRYRTLFLLLTSFQSRRSVWHCEARNGGVALSITVADRGRTNGRRVWKVKIDYYDPSQRRRDSFSEGKRCRLSEGGVEGFGWTCIFGWGYRPEVAVPSPRSFGMTLPAPGLTGKRTI